MNKSSILLALFFVVAQTFAETSPPLSAKTSDSLATSAKAVLEAKLLEPLQKKEASRSHFSRAALPPQTRRIRILNNAPQTDAKGHSFVPFAIDQSHAYGGDKEIPEANWFKDVITGCVYPDTGDVMVRRGEAYYPSSILLGSAAPLASGDVCQPH
jgi:hypothetical protein